MTAYPDLWDNLLSSKKVFLISEAFLYIVFMTMDLLRTSDTSFIKFAAICLIGISTLRNCERYTAKAQRLTPLADVFLLLLNGIICYTIGVFIFFAVQILYTFRLRSVRPEREDAPERMKPSKQKDIGETKDPDTGKAVKGDPRLKVIFAAEAVAFSVGLILILRQVPGIHRPEYFLTLAVLIYVVHFALINLTGAFGKLHRQRRKSDHLFFWGLLLYFICDLFVGIWNMPETGGVLREIARVAMWGFYLPGQVLIRISACEKS